MHHADSARRVWYNGRATRGTALPCNRRLDG